MTIELAMDFIANKESQDKLSFALKASSWKNLFRVIRHKDTVICSDTSNFWATIQELERQFNLCSKQTKP